MLIKETAVTSDFHQMTSENDKWGSLENQTQTHGSLNGIMFFNIMGII